MNDRKAVLKFFKYKNLRKQISIVPSFDLKIWIIAFRGKKIRQRGSALLLINATVELSRRKKLQS